MQRRQRVLRRGDEGLFRRLRRACVAGDDLDLRRDLEGFAHLLRRVLAGVLELVDGHQERQPARLEEVDRGEAIRQPARVDQDDRRHRAADEVVPHEPEPVLARRAEHVEDQVVGQGEPAEVHRHRRGELPRHRFGPVDADGRGRHHGFGAQRVDLRDGADESRLAGPEPAGDHDLGRGDPLVRVHVVH
jgi:hypothetical protein